MELSAGENDEEDVALETETPSNPEDPEQPMPLEFFSSASTGALELEGSASQDISLTNSELLEEESDNEQPLVLYILADDAT